MTLANSLVVTGVLSVRKVTVPQQPYEAILAVTRTPISEVNSKSAGERLLRLTFSVKTLRRGDSRNMPDNVLRKNLLDSFHELQMSPLTSLPSL